MERYHYIRDTIIEKDVVLKHIFTSNMVADPFTKLIARDVIRVNDTYVLPFYT